MVLAPTGVAALNVHGQTIHSFFGFSPQVTPQQAKKEHPNKQSKKLIQKLDLIIIDEVSMLRADLLDSIDQALRQYGNSKMPFGGKRMVFIGDLYQLPPVLTKDERQYFLEQYASPYFFDAQVFKECDMSLFELQKVYRQQDQTFVELLNKVRDNQLQPEELQKLNDRYDPYYQAFQKPNEVTLCTTNAAANRINKEQLEQLDGKKIKFSCKTSGEFIRQLPTEENLNIKVGAQVMLVNNDSLKRWVNGSTGKITDILWSEELEQDVVLVQLQSGKTVEVTPYTWETNQYFFDEKEDEIQSETIGSFTQYPLKLAWAITIHKSQGKTFENLVLDIGRGTFAHGQIYVALSRCTSLEGITLRQTLQSQHIWSDLKIQQYFNAHQQGRRHQQLTLPEKQNLLESCIDNQSVIQLTYAMKDGSAITKTVLPVWLGELEYNGFQYMALETQDPKSGYSRSYSLKRILHIETSAEFEAHQLNSIW